MFVKIRRDTLVILILAFMLIVSGRFMTYMSFASTPGNDSGVPISGVIIKGNDIVPTDSIRSNIAQAGLRPGSYIKGNNLVTSKRELPLNEAIEAAKKYAMMTTISGTKISPIVAVDITVDKEQGIVVVNVVEDFSTVVINNTNGG
ncbi:MAG: hypothetical protein FJ150_00975 [Euryarchaeota archaeon]|nr:hypothetical protein [Euryarchaeota archaeon]